MGTAMGKPSFVALLPEPVSETGRRERLPESRCQERHVAGNFGKNLGELGMDRDHQFGAGLDLANLQHAVPDVLPAHANHVRTPLARVGQEGERQPRLRPAMEAVRLGPGWRARPALDYRLASRSQPRASSSPAELRRPWQARKRHRFEARPAEVETRLAVAINEALHNFGAVSNDSLRSTFVKTSRHSLP